MTRIRQVKTSFTAGEISPLLLGRGDLRAYENGAKTLDNVTIHPTGGVSRRNGLYFIDAIAGPGRLVAFEFNTEQTYLLAIINHTILIYHQGVQVATITAPWTEEQIRQITWTQSADTLLLCHPNVPPKKLIRLGDTSWQLLDWEFQTDSTTNAVQQPYYKYAAESMTITPSGTTGTITLTTNGAVFQSTHANTRLRIAGKEVLINSISSPTVVNATVIQTLANTNPTTDWAEQAFSPLHGWPQCAVFHQDRLVIGGSRDLPNRLWFSQSGQLWNFNKGTGLDDESIEFSLLSDQVNAIRALFSGRHLQVFTSGAEWIVIGSPLTPQSIQLNRQTRIGAVMERYIPPVNVDGATLFVGRTGQELREFLYADVEQAYQANDLAILARHLFNQPVDQAFDPLSRVLYAPLSDGTLATLTLYRTESVSAWSRMKTNGNFLSVCAIGNDMYVLVERNGYYLIEKFTADARMDSALSGSANPPTATWSGLSHLDGQTVQIIADGIVQPSKTVISGMVTLDKPARDVIMGLKFTHRIEPLPANAYTLDGVGRTLRLVDVTFRLHDTQALTIDSGRGPKDIALRRLGHDNLLDAPPPLTSGDIKLRAFGWHRDSSQPLWQITQDMPLPCTILSVTMQLKVNE
ncbi:MAG TPA: hypothetical protein VGF14_07365 [Alphaproteobacteria bacterium]